jgi:hypothetical protein
MEPLSEAEHVACDSPRSDIKMELAWKGNMKTADDLWTSAAVLARGSLSTHHDPTIPRRVKRYPSNHAL